MSIATTTFIFLRGGYLGNRAPSVAMLIDMLEFLVTAPYSLIANGHIFNIAYCIGLWAIFWALGRSISFLLSSPPRQRIEQALLNAALGAGAASLMLLTLAAMGRWSLLVLRVLYFAMLPAAIALLHKEYSHRDANVIPLTHAPLHGWTMVAGGFATALWASQHLLSIAATSTPEKFYDALVYHLAIPKLYLLSEGLTPIPHNLYSGFPQGAAMLYGWCIALSNESLAMLLHCSFGIAASIAVYGFGRKIGGTFTGIAAALMFSTTPVVAYASTQAGADLAAAFYLCMAFIALTPDSDGGGEPASLSNAALGGLLLGYAFGVKYTAVTMGTAILLAHLVRDPSQRTLRHIAFAALAATLAFLPWGAKNYLEFSNPFYPFFSHFFNVSGPFQWREFLSDAHAVSPIAQLSNRSGIQRMLRLPWQLVTDNYAVYRASLGMLIAMPPLLIQLQFEKQQLARRSLASAAAAVFTISYTLWALNTDISRFLIPALTVGSCISAYALFSQRLHEWAKVVATCALLLISVANLGATYIEGTKEFNSRWRAVTHADRQKHLNEAAAGYGQPPFPGITRMNQALPPNSVVLFVGESRAYYSDRRFIAASVFDLNPLWAILQRSKSTGDVLRGLRELGVTHVFVNAFQLYADSMRAGVLPRDIARSPLFGKFWSENLILIDEIKEYDQNGRISRWQTLYQLAPASNAHNSTNPILDILATVDK